jgi:hypothetical protein
MTLKFTKNDNEQVLKLEKPEVVQELIDWLNKNKQPPDIS